MGKDDWFWSRCSRGNDDVMNIFLGTLFIIIGVIVRALGFKELKDKNYWRIISKNYFIESGIYKYIRHPMYSGSISIFLGLCIIFGNNLFISFFMMTLLTSFMLDRIDREEQLMVMNNGDKYIQYMNKTKMFIPFII